MKLLSVALFAFFVSCNSGDSSTSSSNSPKVNGKETMGNSARSDIISNDTLRMDTSSQNIKR